VQKKNTDDNKISNDSSTTPCSGSHYRVLQYASNVNIHEFKINTLVYF